MKTRTDPTPLSKTINSFTEVKTDASLDIDENADLEDEEIEDYAVYDLVQEPPAKRIRTYSATPKIIKEQAEQCPSSSEQHDEESEATRTIEYTLINGNEDTSELVPLTKKQYVEYQEASDFDEQKQKRFKKRCKAFSKYVETLMHEITDEKIFFETQRDITNLIHEATIKQSITLRNS
jgi:hypothetical protein